MFYHKIHWYTLYILYFKTSIYGKKYLQTLYITPYTIIFESTQYNYFRFLTKFAYFQCLQQNYQNIKNEHYVQYMDDYIHCKN